MRREGEGHGLHGVLVLGVVLRRVEQRLGERGVVGASDERRIVPASTREVTVSPMRRTSISGVAPSRPSTEKVQHEG